MNYLQLGRELDRMAREDGEYIDCPDDILKLVIEYTGQIDRKPTFLYKITTRFNYDRTRYRILSNRYENKIVLRNASGCMDNYYCSCCDRFYKGWSSHLKTDKHIRNMKNGDCGKRIDVLEQVEKYYLHSRICNIKVKDEPRIRDVWRW